MENIYFEYRYSINPDAIVVILNKITEDNNESIEINRSGVLKPNLLEKIFGITWESKILKEQKRLLNRVNIKNINNQKRDKVIKNVVDINA